jgi:hypothetical protein
MEIKLHYHNDPPRGWLKILPGTWVQDSGFWVRRASDIHIYDILVDAEGHVYFWNDWEQWVPEPGAKYANVEEAKAVAAVLFRLKEQPKTD